MKNKIFSLKWILVLAAILRFSFLGSIPISLNWDEISMGYTAYSVGETGRDEWGEFLPIFFRSYGEWKSAVYIYLLVPFIKFLGMNAWTVRLPSALCGIISVYLIYLLGRRLYSERVGLWSALLMAVTPWSLVLSRPAFEANVSLTLLLAGTYFFLAAMPRNKLLPVTTSYNKLRLILSAIFFGLAPHTYNSGKIIVPFAVLYLIFATKFYKHVRLTLVYLGVLALFAIPILTNLFTGRAQYRYTQVGVTTDQTSLTNFCHGRDVLPGLVGKLVFNKATFFTYRVVDNWFSYLNPSFLFISAGDHNQHHVPYRGVLYLAEGIFIIFGLFKLKSNNSQLRLFPLVIIALGLLPGALTRDSEHVLRTILAIPGFILLAAIGAEQFYAAMPLRSLWRRGVIWLLLFEICSFLVQYFFWYPKVTASDWQYGYEQVAEYVRTHESEYDHIVMTKWFGEPQLFLAFYNRWDPVWYQAQNQKLLTYEAEGRLWLDQLPEYKFGKYTFRYLNWTQESRGSNTLYISKWDDFYPDSHYVSTIRYPSGSVAFQLVVGDIY